MSDTPARRFAAIDIGSNAVRLLIGVVTTDGQFLQEVFTRLPLALGDSTFASSRRIRRADLQRLQKTMAGMRLFIDAMQPVAWRAVATAAIRDARNSKAVIDFLVAEAGVTVDLLSGEEEAAIIGRFVAAQFADSRVILNIDAGGGSTDCALMVDGTIAVADTFALGTARPNGGDTAEKERLTGWLQQIKKQSGDMLISGSGGSVRKLADLCGNISRQRLAEWEKRLVSVSPLTIATRYDLSPDRASRVVAAIRIYRLILKTMGGVINPIAGGLAEAVLRELAEKDSQSA